jgi:predicted ester cyclase
MAAQSRFPAMDQAARDRVAHVTTFLDRMRTQDFDAMAECVTEDVHRIGPFRDQKRGRADYRDFLADQIRQLPEYQMDIYRVWSDGTRAVAELAEQMRIEGRLRRTEEALTFEFAPDGLISKVAVYIQTSWFPEEQPDR